MICFLVYLIPTRYFSLFSTHQVSCVVGLELTFFSGVYGTCVGHTKLFHDPTSLQGLMGVFIGVGEIVGKI